MTKKLILVLGCIFSTSALFGMDAQALSQDESEALMAAVQYGEADVIEELIKTSPDIDIPDRPIEEEILPEHPIMPPPRYEIKQSLFEAYQLKEKSEKEDVQEEIDWSETPVGRAIKAEIDEDPSNYELWESLIPEKYREQYKPQAIHDEV